MSANILGTVLVLSVDSQRANLTVLGVGRESVRSI